MIRGSALIVNLPGQPKSIRETLEGAKDARRPAARGGHLRRGALLHRPHRRALPRDPRRGREGLPAQVRRPPPEALTLLPRDTRMELLSHIELATGADPRGTVIWMHGLGADGWDFVPIVRELDLPEELALRFIFPHAPVRPVTINNGHAMRAWYDIAMADIGRASRRAGHPRVAGGRSRRSSRARSRAASPRTASCSRDSRRAARSRCTRGCGTPSRLAGILALSTYLPLAETLDRESSDANDRVPDLHGARHAGPGRSARRSRESSRAAGRARPTRRSGTPIRCPIRCAPRKWRRSREWLAARYASPILAA